MQPENISSGKSLSLNIQLDKADAEVLFLLAIHSDQSLEDVALGLIEEATSDLRLDASQHEQVQAALEEYQRTGKFDPTRWRS